MKPLKTDMKIHLLHTHVSVRLLFKKNIGKLLDYSIKITYNL